VKETARKGTWFDWEGNREGDGEELGDSGDEGAIGNEFVKETVRK
jgi:hypothetical protein